MNMLLYILGAIFVGSWMFYMLKLTRQIRIINSMTLKVILKKMEADNINIDISEIEKEILRNL
ncbi:MAG TPA: hypothetical protein PLC27_00295 [Saprospiraceae bacterium]|jgi:hypothetical protein|nr:hypothetical protein [Saprospiraceae bacterium]MBK6666650.1 hypothetical protein [Saprospiraceae bacterium]MBK7698448.1 hypothetical protein [Saprospiraceae bacterium]MBK8828266.1 hypothetical protein [Saprospiraceae bacterium]MBK8887704.1 hypothetical protein [Saprospiraceae bacterium]